MDIKTAWLAAGLSLMGSISSAVETSTIYDVTLNTPIAMGTWETQTCYINISNDTGVLKAHFTADGESATPNWDISSARNTFSGTSGEPIAAVNMSYCGGLFNLGKLRWTIVLDEAADLTDPAAPVFTASLDAGGLYEITLTTRSAGGSGGSGGGSGATGPANVIQSDAMRATRSAVTANNSMMLKGLTRFMADRLSGMPMADAISTSGVSSVVVTPGLKVLEDTLFGSGSFAGQSVSADGTYRRVTFGEFDIQHEMGAGTTASFNGRMAWERAAGDDAMIAYFLGAEVNRSDIEGDYSGSQNRYGLMGGVYGFKALENNIFLAGYGSLGAARSSLDISDGAGSDVTGDFTSRTLSVGGQLSGQAEYEGFDLRPMLNVNVVKTWVGDITMDESGTSIDVAVGDTTFAELIASPEFLFPLEQHAESKMVTVASVAPRVICERTDSADTISSQCGAGLELGINGTSEDGATSLNAGLRFDRVGGIDRKGLNLQADFRF